MPRRCNIYYDLLICFSDVSKLSRRFRAVSGSIFKVLVHRLKDEHERKTTKP